PDPNVSAPFEFYTFGPEAPAKARALSPEALDRWLKTTDDARELLRSWVADFRPLRVRERANHRSLAVFLAGELYHRHRGASPPSDEALVGPYLKELPDDGPDDGAGPTGSAATAGGVQNSTATEK